MGEGLGGGDTAQLTDDRLMDAVEVYQDLVVPKPQKAIAFVLQEPISFSLLRRRSIVLAAVDFHDQPGLVAYKIGNVAANRPPAGATPGGHRPLASRRTVPAWANVHERPVSLRRPRAVSYCDWPQGSRARRDLRFYPGLNQGMFYLASFFFDSWARAVSMSEPLSSPNHCKRPPWLS
jgi:hypothetical protein